MYSIIKVALFAGASAFLTGCAATVTAWKNDPLQSYEVLGPSVYAMTGDRRTAVFTKPSNGGPLRYCAESLPDAVAVFAAASSANLKAEGISKTVNVEVGATDRTTAGLLQTFQRTEIAEVFRQLGWNTCIAWSQEAITSDQYFGLLERMVIGGVDMIKTRAAQTQVMQTIPSTSVVVQAPEQAPSNSSVSTPATAPTSKPLPASATATSP